MVGVSYYRSHTMDRPINVMDGATHKVYSWVLAPPLAYAWMYWGGFCLSLGIRDWFEKLAKTTTDIFKQSYCLSKLVGYS